MATQVVDVDERALKELEEELTELANAQFESDAYKHMLSVPFSLKGCQEFFKQHALFNLNRRDCWGYVQAKAPMPAKQFVWDHETEELDGVPSRGGLNHYELAVKQGEAWGLTPEDYYNTEPLDGTFTCCQAWISLAQNEPWRVAFASSSALEYSNSDDIIRGGGISRRIGQKLERELGIPMRKQVSNEEHTVAEIEHAQMLMRAARQFGQTPEDRAQLLDGAKKTWQIDRIFRGFLGDLMENYAD
ncbi:MAG: iron-containing redox enzyme family protein [Alphaproteobacteria bacterium]|nr:iron-containing redox enzyme family protein [Alphaproteobacteria bacterium]